MSYDHPGRSTEDGLAVSPPHPVSLLVGALGPRIQAAAVGAGRPAPRIVAGLLVAGVTGIIADVVPAGPDEAASRRRTTDLLRELTALGPTEGRHWA
jgi:hypothetical protein